MVPFNPQVYAPAQLKRTDLTDRQRHDLEFYAAHWRARSAFRDPVTLEPKVFAVECDLFDRVSRLCGAHEDRPAVCAGYPWYGREPLGCGSAVAALPPQCSYTADVRRMLPIVEVR